MAEPGIGTLIIALIDGKFDAMDRQISSLREELDEKMSDVTLKLKKLGDDANAHSEKLNELDAKQVELSKSIALLQKPLNSLAKVEEMVRDLGEEYNNVQEEVSRQKELQVTMLEQHNDLRLTVHRQQGFINTVLGAAANYPGGGAKSASVRPVSASSPTLNGNTSPNRFPDESTEEENRKRTAFARNSASFDAEAIDSNAMRADSVPASLKRRKAKQDLKAGHERHSSESGILYEQHRSSDEIVLVAAQVHRRASRELPLQSPGTRKILEALENGRDSAEVLRAERGGKSAVERKSATLNLPAPEHSATQPMAPRVPESPPSIVAELPRASTQPAIEAVTPGPRRSAREPKRVPPHGKVDLRKLKPGQLSRGLTEEEIENARP